MRLLKQPAGKHPAASQNTFEDQHTFVFGPSFLLSTPPVHKGGYVWRYRLICMGNQTAKTSLLYLSDLFSAYFQNAKGDLYEKVDITALPKERSEKWIETIKERSGTSILHFPLKLPVRPHHAYCFFLCIINDLLANLQKNSHFLLKNVQFTYTMYSFLYSPHTKIRFLNIRTKIFNTEFHEKMTHQTPTLAGVF